MYKTLEINNGRTQEKNLVEFGYVITWDIYFQQFACGFISFADISFRKKRKVYLSDK
jgi:hypothetical protein